MMILCPACQRHLFAGEASCPFCGLALAPEPARAQEPDTWPELSRAQRYAIGAAIAVSIAGTGCGGTQTTDTTNPSGGTTNPSGGTTNAVAGPAEGEQDAGVSGHKDTDELEWRRRGNPCTPEGLCPPYGCVFPDEECDIVRA